MPILLSPGEENTFAVSGSQYKSLEVKSLRCSTSACWSVGELGTRDGRGALGKIGNYRSQIRFGIRYIRFQRRRISPSPTYYGSCNPRSRVRWTPLAPSRIRILKTLGD